MTKQEQLEFVNELTESVKETVIQLIDTGRVPADWDGHELRQLLADKFTSQKSHMSRSRMIAYNRVVLNNNL